MNRHIKESADDIGSLVEQGRELVGHVRDKAVAKARATHKAVNQHPYPAIGITLGLGVLIGFFLGRGGSGDGEERE